MNIAIVLGMILAIVVNTVVAVLSAWRRRWFIVAVNAALVIVQAWVILQRLDIAYNQGKIDAFNEVSGCGPDAPKVVPYHPGMTLCPGQRTTITVPLPQATDRPL